MRSSTATPPRGGHQPADPSGQELPEGTPTSSLCVTCATPPATRSRRPLVRPAAGRSPSAAGEAGQRARYATSSALSAAGIGRQTSTRPGTSPSPRSGASARACSRSATTRSTSSATSISPTAGSRPRPRLQIRASTRSRRRCAGSRGPSTSRAISSPVARPRPRVPLQPGRAGRAPDADPRERRHGAVRVHRPEHGQAPNPARISLYGHGLLGSHSEVEAGNVRAMATEHNMVFCATDWWGLAQGDTPGDPARWRTSTVPRARRPPPAGGAQHAVPGRLMNTRPGSLPARRSSAGAPRDRHLAPVLRRQQSGRHRGR